MTIAEQINRVLEAQPFAQLGPHKNTKGWMIRVFLADVDSITVTNLAGSKELGTMKQVDPLGLFELQLTTKTRPIYRLQVTQGAEQWSLIDAYQFEERSMTDFPCDSDSLYKTMGAQVCSVETKEGEVHGVRFAVYAPNARVVSVIGNFNNWDGRRHPMQSNSDGIWRLFVPEIVDGDAYKFELKDAREHLDRKSVV